MALAALAPVPQPLAQGERSAPPRVEPAAETMIVELARVSLQTYLTTRPDLSNSDVATGIGMSPGVISEFRAGKYKGDAVGVAKRLMGWLDLEGRRAGVMREPLWVETRNATRVWKIFEQCHELGDLGLVYGAAGTGKTRTATEYTAQHKDAILLIAHEAVRSPHPLFIALARKLGLPTGYALDALFDATVERLGHSGRLLIVDEAQCLTYRTLNLLRNLYDQAEIGLVLLGDEVLWRSMYEGRTRAQWERLVSRNGIKWHLTAGFPRRDVAGVARQFLGHTDKGCMQYLEAKAGGVGGLRSVVKHCRLAARHARAKGRDTVELADLRAASQIMGDGIEHAGEPVQHGVAEEA